MVAAVVVGGGFEALVAVTGIGGQPLEAVADKYVYTALELIAVAVCAARVVRRRDDRVAWGLMTVALIAWTGGDLVWTVWLDGVANPPYPSIADVLYLAMYPAVYVAMMLLIRTRLRNAGAAQWLDGAVVGLTIASVGAALVFGPVLATSSGHAGAEIVSVAYPVGDFVLLICVAVAYSLAGWRPGRAWLLFGAGVTLMAAADVIFSYQTATSTYVPGTPLDVLWPLSMALLAFAAWTPIARPGHDQVDAPHTIALTPLAATCALAVLVAAGLWPISPLAVALAGSAVVAAGIRGAITYLENVRILRRNAQEASTDPLSGLGNRRRLMGDLELAFAAARAAGGSTLLFFDLNGFKRYNDMFGHAAGDALLARIGARLRAAIGDQGRAYRLGGDEFCVLLDGRLPSTDPLVAAATEALFERGSGFALTSSLGAAILPDDAACASAALALADERMYADKAGRSSSRRAQTRDIQLQLLSERAHGLGGGSGGVGTLAAVVASRLRLVGEELDVVQRAAELHDVGKLAIPDEILHKAAPLSESEWRFMRQHPLIGERIVAAAPALRPVARIVRCTPERWDGKGYPDGIAAVTIPLGARIVAVCAAYAAMTSRRPYRATLTDTEAIAELRLGAGSQFDPQVVEAVCTALGEPLAGLSTRT